MKCHTCKKEFYIPKWKFRSYRDRPANKHFFCSRDCFREFWKVDILPNRINKDNKGITKKCEFCGKVFHRRKRGDRIDRFCDRKCWGKWKSENIVGENNPTWKGNEKEYRNHLHRKWQRLVKKRDNFQCKICGDNESILVAHHIKSYKHYPEMRYEVDNGITFCRKCHIQLHTIHKNIKDFSKILEPIL